MNTRITIDLAPEELGLYRMFAQQIEELRNPNKASSITRPESVAAREIVAAQIAQNKEVGSGPTRPESVAAAQIRQAVDAKVAALQSLDQERQVPVVFTEEDVANATRALAQARGIDAATMLLASFGIEKARELPADKRADYIAQAKATPAVTA